MIESIFEDRVPEAAARQMALLLAHQAEIQLATLEQMLERKSTSKSDIKRQKQICLELLFHIKDMKIRPVGLGGRHCPRLHEALIHESVRKELEK